MTTDNKQSVTLSDAEIISLAYDCNAMPEAMTDAGLKRFARAIIDVALSKLRGAGEPVAEVQLHPHDASKAIVVALVDFEVVDVGMQLYAAPQASAQAPAAAGDALMNELRHLFESYRGTDWGMAAEKIGDKVVEIVRAAPAAEDSAKGAGDVDERAAFESSERNRPGYGEDTLAVYAQNANEYALPLTQARWAGWQARAALSAQPAVSAEPEQDRFKPPFDNCSFRLCDLPGQCRGEGKCHHPAALAANKAHDDPTERFMAARVSVDPVDTSKRQDAPVSTLIFDPNADFPGNDFKSLEHWCYAYAEEFTEDGQKTVEGYICHVMDELEVGLGRFDLMSAVYTHAREQHDMRFGIFKLVQTDTLDVALAAIRQKLEERSAIAQQGKEGA